MWIFDRWCDHEWSTFTRTVLRQDDYDAEEKQISLVFTKTEGKQCSVCGDEKCVDRTTEEWWIDVDDVVVRD